ncbi:MAG: SPOR domain-containing protein [Prevotella sp.]|nr:SPOR domain-containing protein [Candidatus Prevotella equi]
MSRIFLITTMLLAVTIANAQTFLDGLRKAEPGKGRVDVVQTQEIDSLVNGVTKQPVTSVATPQPKQEVAEHKTENNTPATTVTTNGNNSSSEMENTVVDTRKKVMRNSYKMQGYRIQVFSGGNTRADKQKAEAAGAVMKNNFPTEPIYVHFYSPSWKCRMGNYKTVEDARRLLAQVKKLGYQQACIVKGTISVQY